MDESAIRAMYDRFSSIPGFWTVDAWTCRATERSPYRSRVIRGLGLMPSSTVLDVACGTGLNFRLLNAAVGPSGRIVGIDNSAKTIELARRTVRRRGLRNVELVEADAADYRPQEPFDAALCTFAIEIVPRWRETVQMMIDAVRPGGTVGFIGFKESSRRPCSAFNRLWRAVGQPFGGVDLDRDVRRQVGERCDEPLYAEVYGGFYYLLVGRKRESPR
jgi:ubiquinone/menaquinone biosynthesis C-methylase UbiE